MTMRKAISWAFVLAFLVAASPLRAAEPVPTDRGALEKRLATYDPAAVKAARHYYGSPALKAGLVAVIDNVQKSMTGFVSKQNPSLSAEQLAKIQTIVRDSMNERLDLILEMSMVVALDTMTTPEIVALDQFYSSPLGSSIIAKLPQIAARMPSIMQAVMPDYINDIKTKLKAANPELKL
ncbi:MAG: DUF2059 domain-containing protein [Beijerinckiaceae bacterium]|nr:DUF2059 domain-containing protein [Beijerinckiaceae bacterium]